MGLLFTNQMYVNNKYNAKEASIIATGFTTVAISFMVIVARTLDISDYWTLYFFVTLLITFLCTSVTCRIYPLSKKPETYYDPSRKAAFRSPARAACSPGPSTKRSPLWSPPETC